jgi:hypothetical protein
MTTRNLALALSLAGTLLAVPAAASAAVSGFTVVSSGALVAPAGVQTHATVDCPTGTVPLGGGVATTFLSGMTVNGTYPTATGWAADVNNPDASSEAFSVDATCANRPRGYTVVTANNTAPAGQQTVDEAGCPRRTAPLGGGLRSSSTLLSVNLGDSFPSRHQWVGAETNASTVDTQETVFVICGNLVNHAVIRESAAVMPAGNTLVHSSCPAGQVATDGGIGTDTIDPRVTIAGTFPDANGWDLTLRNGTGSGIGYHPFLVCAG